jgi:hypothetical protein
MRKTIILIIGLALLVPATAGAHPSHHGAPRVLTMPWQNTDRQNKPSMVWLAYQRRPDNGIPFRPRIQQIDWKVYNGHQAVGTGLYVNVYWKACYGPNGKSQPPTLNYSNCEKGPAGLARITETQPRWMAGDPAGALWGYSHLTIIPARKQGNDYARNWSWTYGG